MEIPLHDPIEWSRLDAAAFRVSMKRSVRRFAWYEAGVGAVAAACGFAAPLVPLVVIGLSLVCAGVWNIFRPSIVGLVVDGVAAILAGAFNCLAFLWIEDVRASSAGKWITAGVAQIVWGVRRLAIYPTARVAVNDRPAIARLEAMVLELSKRDAKRNPTAVEFRTRGFRRRRNRLGLYAEGVVALLEHQVVRLEIRSDIWVEVRGTTWHGRTLRVMIQMGDLQVPGEMPAAHVERFERWKLGPSGVRSVAA